MRFLQRPGLRAIIAGGGNGRLVEHSALRRDESHPRRRPVLFTWLFDLSAGAQWQTASIVGIIIAVLSIAALACFAVWEEWFLLVAGIGLIVSPWLLGFQNSDAMVINVVIGVAVAVLAAFEVCLAREDKAQVTATE